MSKWLGRCCWCCQFEEGNQKRAEQSGTECLDRARGKSDFHSSWTKQSPEGIGWWTLTWESLWMGVEAQHVNEKVSQQMCTEMERASGDHECLKWRRPQAYSRFRVIVWHFLFRMVSKRCSSRHSSVPIPSTRRSWISSVPLYDDKGCSLVLVHSTLCENTNHLAPRNSYLDPVNPHNFLFELRFSFVTIVWMTSPLKSHRNHHFVSKPHGNPIKTSCFEVPQASSAAWGWGSSCALPRKRRAAPCRRTWVWRSSATSTSARSMTCNEFRVVPPSICTLNLLYIIPIHTTTSCIEDFSKFLWVPVFFCR